MTKAPPEPRRDCDINSLEPYLVERVQKVLDAMRARHMDPIPFETRRTVERQAWLYGVGRTHSLARKPVTYVDGVRKLSMHQRGKAVDIVSRSLLWNAPPAFWNALKAEAKKVGLHTLSFEACHCEWRG